MSIVEKISPLCFKVEIALFFNYDLASGLFVNCLPDTGRVGTLNGFGLRVEIRQSGRESLKPSNAASDYTSYVSVAILVDGSFSRKRSSTLHPG